MPVPNSYYRNQPQMMPPQPMPEPQPTPTPMPERAPRTPNELSRGFAVAGITLAVIATIFALMPLWDQVSVFGVVGLAMTVIGACSMFTDRGRTPVWIGTLIVAALLCVGSIIIVAAY